MWTVLVVTAVLTLLAAVVFWLRHDRRGDVRIGSLRNSAQDAHHDLLGDTMARMIPPSSERRTRH